MDKRRDGGSRWRADAVPWTIETGDGSAEVRVPIVGDDGGCAGTLALAYDHDDPWVVHIQVRAPSGGLVLERAIMRSDLAGTLFRTRTTAALTIGPDEPGCVRLVVYESGATIQLLLPSDVIVLSIRAAERVLPVAEEDRRVERLLREELERTGRLGRAAVREQARHTRTMTPRGQPSV